MDLRDIVKKNICIPSKGISKRVLVSTTTIRKVEALYPVPSQFCL